MQETLEKPVLKKVKRLRKKIEMVASHLIERFQSDRLYTRSRYVALSKSLDQKNPYAHGLRVLESTTRAKPA